MSVLVANILSIFVLFIFIKFELMGGVFCKDDKQNELETLEDFGYNFKNGELRHTSTNQKFEFNIYENHADNQMRYLSLGKVVDKHIYKLLEEEAKLLKVSIPVDQDNAGGGFIFRSEDSFTCEKLVLIIHGSGDVRAGQWSRRLIINHSLESGSQLPYIKRAKELGYGVLVLNSNQNYDEQNGKKIRGSGSPEEHFTYVWNEFVSKSQAQHVAIIAHSYGGVITTYGATTIHDVIMKTFAVAFTDSVHFMVKYSEHQKEFSSWMQRNVCNWASSSKNLDEPLTSHGGGCPTVSAGTQVHGETSWKAFNSVWLFIEKKWGELQHGVKKPSVDKSNLILKEHPSKISPSKDSINNKSAISANSNKKNMEKYIHDTEL